MSSTKRPRRAAKEKPALDSNRVVKRRTATLKVDKVDGVNDIQVATRRCPWSTQFAGAADPDYVTYHDEEWGRPVKDDVLLYELLVLEGAQAGLSWHTILKKRAAYRSSFCGFDPSRVALFGDVEVEGMLGQEGGVVRHRAKILSAINNARRVLEVQREFGSFSKFMWSFMPDSRPLMNGFTLLTEVPAKSSISEAMSKDLKQRGFSFVGPTTCYSLMQATGMVNDHLTDCFCYEAVRQAAAHWAPPE